MSNSTESTGRPLAAIILAAGKGTRMKSDRPKVVHEVADHAMVHWVVESVRGAGATPIVLIIGHGADEVKSVFTGATDIGYAVQAEQLGTGHATDCARELLGSFEGDVLVLAGDGPLIRASTIRTMHERHVETKAAATLATSIVDDPTGYGRVVRGADNRFDRIVEQKNATDDEKAIREIYPSYACFDAAELFNALANLERDPVSDEYYITDVPAMLKAAGKRIEIVDAVPPEDVLSVNTTEQLADVDAILRARLGDAS